MNEQDNKDGQDGPQKKHSFWAVYFGRDGSGSNLWIGDIVLSTYMIYALISGQFGKFSRDGEPFVYWFGTIGMGLLTLLFVCHNIRLSWKLYRAQDDEKT